MKLTTDRYEAPRGLFATAELLVIYVVHFREYKIFQTSVSASRIYDKRGGTVKTK